MSRPIPDPKHHDNGPIIMVRSSFGKNASGGNDYWVTMRGAGDRLSNDWMLEGTVQNGIVKVTGAIQPEVAEHLQVVLDAAYAAHDADVPRHNAPIPENFEERGVRVRRYLKGPLAYAQEELYAKKLELPALWGKDGTDRYFIHPTRDGAARMASLAA